MYTASFDAAGQPSVMCRLQGMGLHGIPMGNMSNQQLMQMQLHGMDLQRVGMGLPGLLLHCDINLVQL